MPPELIQRFEQQREHLLIADERRLGSLLRRADGGQPVDRERLVRDLDAALLKAENRLRLKPALIHFPDELPVSQAREEIGRAILQNQVIVLCGETGSGKTTQLPKLCLELGRGTRGLIGHTQPRRLAARSVATRIAQELGSPLGQLVGYETRFDRRVGDASLIKLMTDGILLAELQRDRELTAYDTIIIDEAHERSLNIDFLLGWLKRLLPRRPDLKLIVTSATLDPERLAKHFESAGGPAPILKVEGRTFPVTMRYREPDPDLDLEGQVANGIDELWAGGGRPGDVLVFLPGEREIRDLVRSLPGRFPKAEVLPLYSRLPAEQQDRVFGRGSAPRIVLATNVAETSVTVPGIRYVVDTGTARINRYSTRLGVQQLQIEGISQAAANQRAGRCGRVGPGTCLRLYTEADFQSRDLFTDPEVLRSNLAGVILQMAALGLGDVDDFPWVDAPENRHISEGYRLLQVLGALDDERRLTPLGRELARLPLDPRIARIVAAGKGQEQDAVCVLAAALSVQDPHEVPPDQQTQARQKHAVWRHPRSDFYTLLNLWREWQKWSEGASNRALRKICREQYVSYLRMEEWESVYKQIVDMTRPRTQPPSVRAERSEGRAAGSGEGLSVTPKAKLNAQSLAFARELRTQSTDAESKLWYLLRDRRLNGLKFRRQHPVGDYTLDFYCEQYRLAVELDGGQHGEAAQQAHDAERAAFLAARGIRVLRFWNDEFLNQPEAVLEAILAATQTPSPGPSGHPLPVGEGKSPNGGDGLPLPPGEVGASAPGEGVGRPRGAGSTLPERDTEGPSPGRSGRPEGKATRREGQTVAVSRAPSPGPSGHPLPLGEGRSPNGGDGLPLPPGEVGASAPGEGVGRPRGAGSVRPERDTEIPSPGPVGHPVPLGERKKLADLSVDKLEELYPQIHKALAAGLIDHIGLRLPAEKNERPEFQGPRGRKYRVFPGSTLAKKPPPWLLSAQLSQTSQLFARTNAEVQPQWLSDVGAHLVKKTVTHPVWNPERGEVQCTEYHTLFGLQLLKRTCHYGSIDPVDARRIFILEGLVRGQWTAKPRFLTDNLKLVDDVQDKEARMRRPDLLADESQRYAFYDERIPPQICTANTLKAWLRTASADKGDPGRLLRMQETDVLRPGADADVEARFPDFIDIGGHTLALSYQHEPGEDEDGVSFHIPLTLLYQLPDAPFDYLVPGLLAPRIEALIRSLPMNLRRLCTPAAEYANALATRISVGDGDFLQSVVRHFDAMTGVKLKPDDFDPGKLPAHLRPTLVLEDAQGQVIARADSLAALKRDHQQPARVAIAASAQREDAARRWVRSDIRDWDFGDLPEHVDLSGGGRAWPALTTAAAAAAATPSRRTGSLPAVTPPAPTPAPPRKLPPPPPAPRAAPAAPPSSPGKPSKPAVIESLQGLAQLRGSLPAAPSSPPPPPPPPPTVAAAPAATRPASASSAPASASVTAAAGSVSLALFESPDAARLAHIAGVRALLLAKLADRVRDLVKTARSRLGLAAVNPIITPEALAQAVAERAAAQTWDLASLRSEAAFKEAVQHRGDFGRVAVKLLDEACGWLMAAADLRKALRDSGSRSPEAAADIRQQLDSLLAPGLIDALPDEQWPRVAVWLKAIAIRLQRLPNKPQRDIELTAPIRALVAQLPHPFHPARWIVEEWRVAQFAQELKAIGSPTPDRVVQRLREPV